MNEEYKEVSLRCLDYDENLVLKKFYYPDEEKWYEFTIEDSYCGGNYLGILGRFKRAWKAFWSEPVSYARVCCDNEETLRTFIIDCLNIIEQ